jgi:uncharacterized protein (DUF362 family)/ferredoxin-like protein FixX
VTDIKKVSIKANATYESDMIKYLGDSIIELGAEDILKKRNQKIILKINVAGPFSVDKAATTNPEVVRAAIRLIKEAGSIPILGDTPNSRLPCFEIAGFEQLAKEEEVSLIKFKNFKKIASNGEEYKEIEYASEIIEADKLISMAKMKTHALVHYTGAVKNMFGGVSPQQRKIMHLNEDTSVFVNALIDVFLTRKPDFAIVDGITAMEGLGPTHGRPIYAGILACGENSFYTDMFCAKLMGYDVKKVPFFIEAEKRGFLKLADEIEVIGNIEDYKGINFQLVPIMSEPSKKRYLKMALGSPVFDYEKCIKCKLCVNSCPAKAIRMVDEHPVVFGQRCINCYCCNELCPVGAVEFKTRKLVIRNNE